MTIIEKYQIKNYHSSRLRQRGNKPSKILGWTSKDVQLARFKVITSSLDFNDVSVLDVGCGYGDLKSILDRQYHGFDYIGLDQQPEFIERACQRFKGHDHTWFYHTDFTRCQLPLVDIVVASGVLSYRCNNPEYYLRTVQQFYKSAKKALIFNMLDEDHFESGPLIVSHNRNQIFKQCQEFCKEVTLKIGYLDNDFTIVMKKA